MMPDVTRPRDVIDWSPGTIVEDFPTPASGLAGRSHSKYLRFSMLVPNSTNLTAVLAHIAGKDSTEI